MGRAWLANWAEVRGTLLGQDQKGGEEELGLRPEQRGEFSSFLFFSFFFISKSFLKQFRNHFKNILTLPKFTQYNENKCYKYDCTTSC